MIFRSTGKAFHSSECLKYSMKRVSRIHATDLEKEGRESLNKRGVFKQPWKS